MITGKCLPLGQRLLREEVGVGQPDALPELGGVVPAQRVQLRHVHELAGRAVGLCRVEGQVAPVAHRLPHQPGQLPDGDVLAGADVHQLTARVGLHEKQAGLGQIVCEEELPARAARAPDGHRLRPALPGLVEAADEGRQHVRVLRVVVVAVAVEVGGHHADEVRPVLVAVGLAELDAGDLGDGVGLVGRLQLPGEQIPLLQRLGG